MRLNGACFCGHGQNAVFNTMVKVILPKCQGIAHLITSKKQSCPHLKVICCSHRPDYERLRQPLQHRQLSEAGECSIVMEIRLGTRPIMCKQYHLVGTCKSLSASVASTRPPPCALTSSRSCRYVMFISAWIQNFFRSKGAMWDPQCKDTPQVAGVPVDTPDRQLQHPKDVSQRARCVWQICHPAVARRIFGLCHLCSR